MPGLWADLECPESELSQAFRKAAARHREQFKQLGFAEVGFKKLKGVLNPNLRDIGGINFLDGSRRHFGQLLYNRSYVPELQTENEFVAISFTAVFPAEVFGCTNRVEFLEPIPGQNVIRLSSVETLNIHEKFIQHLKQRTDSPREFPDLASLQTWFDANATESFEFRVRRGSWVRMSDYEVEKARRKLE